jgi:hypothetical protein
LNSVGWDADDLVTSFPCFLVSDRLAKAMTEAHLTGLELADVEVTVDDQFRHFFPETADSLPGWRWLTPVGEPWASDLWVDERADLHASFRAMTVLRRFSLIAEDLRCRRFCR